MHKKNIWSNLGNITLFTWVLACLVIFMYFPGAISQIQDVSLYNYADLPGKLSRISLIKYIYDILKSIIGMLFYGSACISLGRAILPLFHLDNRIIENSLPLKNALIPTYFLLGNAIFSVIFLSLATVLHLSATLSVVILFVGLISGLTSLKKPFIPKFRTQSGYGKILSYSTFILLVISLLHSSARLSYDASSMYFSIAKLTAIENHANFYMENSFPISALHAVIQYSAIIQIFGDQTARMVSWLFGVTIIAIAIALAKVTRISSLARHILPILILTSTAFFDQMGDGKVDLIGTAYSLATIFWLVINSEDKQHQTKHLHLLSGFFIGFSSILRPYNAFLLGVFVIAYFIQRIKLNRSSFTQSGRQLGWMFAGAVGFAFFHFAINYIVLDSPFSFMNSLTTVNPNNAPWDYKPESEWVNKLLYPFVITF